MPTLPQAVTTLLCFLTIASDLYERRVRNMCLLSALLIGTGWLVWMWMQQTAAPLAAAASGLVIGLLVLLPFYVFGWMGAGDVKFFATLGFFLGGKALLPIWIIDSVLGGVHAAMILSSRFLISHFSPGWSVLRGRILKWPAWQRVQMARNGRKGLPYAAYMAIGALLTMTFTNLTHW
jgi:prepilin peptidase CpaA